MTPFGRRVRELRAQRGVSQRDMADSIGVSAAYVSALEHGQRGLPSWDYVQRVISYFNVIWDDAEELQQLAGLSHPRIVIDTGDLSAEATEYANYLAKNIRHLDRDDFDQLLHETKIRVHRRR